MFANSLSREMLNTGGPPVAGAAAASRAALCLLSTGESCGTEAGSNCLPWGGVSTETDPWSLSCR